MEGEIVDLGVEDFGDMETILLKQEAKQRKRASRKADFRTDLDWTSYILDDGRLVVQVEPGLTYCFENIPYDIHETVVVMYDGTVFVLSSPDEDALAYLFRYEDEWQVANFVDGADEMYEVFGSHWRRLSTKSICQRILEHEGIL